MSAAAPGEKAARRAEEPQHIAVAVVQWAGQVLIGPRRPDAPLGGFWEFPGGKVAAGESPAAAAARECLEETGVAVRIGELLAEVDFDCPHARLRIAFFAAEPLDPSPPPQAPFRWAPREDLARHAFPPANARVLAWLAADGHA